MAYSSNPTVIREAYNPDDLVIGQEQAKKVILTADGELTRSTVLGEVNREAGTPVADEGNDGAGTCTLILKGKAKHGNYELICTTLGGEGVAKFELRDPDGAQLGILTAGTALETPQIDADVATTTVDWAVGDKWTLPVETPSTVYHKKSVKTAVDGSQYPDCILAEDAGSDSETKTTAAYEAGKFNENALTHDDSHALADIKTAFRKLGIFLKSVVTTTGVSVS